nr:hypothetical protein Iba_chr02cCG15700 [Ipomoea batatas]
MQKLCEAQTKEHDQIPHGNKTKQRLVVARLVTLQSPVCSVSGFGGGPEMQHYSPILITSFYGCTEAQIEERKGIRFCQKTRQVVEAEATIARQREAAIDVGQSRWLRSATAEAEGSDREGRAEGNDARTEAETCEGTDKEHDQIPHGNKTSSASSWLLPVDRDA